MPRKIGKRLRTKNRRQRKRWGRVREQRAAKTTKSVKER